MASPTDLDDTVRAHRHWPAALVWALAAAAMVGLDGRIDLASQALLLVLAAAVAALWLAPVVSMAASAAAVLAFNVAFVPPRGRLEVDLRQHALLLLTMLGVSWIVALLVARQRELAVRERQAARRARQLREVADQLRDADDPRRAGEHLLSMLGDLSGAPAALLLPRGVRVPDRVANDALAADGDALVIGTLSADERAGLWLCHTLVQAFGPGTGRHEEQPGWFLPLRGRHASVGAALLRWPGEARETGLVDLPADAGVRREHAQALCDLLGLAIERADAMAAAAAARDEAQSQQLRNTLLTAVSHDFRTPLATIMGAASSLHDQGERLSAVQRTRLAASIVGEAEQLARLAANALQLARLDTPRPTLQLEWESPEELVGSTVRRLRQRETAQRIRLRLEPGLPLVRCDAVLMVQLLENLIDNALKYGGSEAPVEVLVRRIGAQLLLAVRDRGPGVAPDWRERIFEVFQRGASAAQPPGSADAPARRGAGVGLAVCRAIARAHGGELRLRARGHGGSSFECVLPLDEMPVPPAVETAS